MNITLLKLKIAETVYKLRVSVAKHDFTFDISLWKYC